MPIKDINVSYRTKDRQLNAAIRLVQDKINEVIKFANTPISFPSFLHNLLSEKHSDTIVADAVRGDLVYADASALWARFVKGSAGQLLGYDADDLVKINPATLDVDKVDGSHASAFAPASHTHKKVDITDLYIKSSVAWDPPSLASGASATKIVTVTGAAFGDFVSVSMNATLRGFILTGYVNAANQVTIVLANVGAATYNHFTQTFYIRVWKRV